MREFLKGRKRQMEKKKKSRDLPGMSYASGICIIVCNVIMIIISLYKLFF